jgi:hypothetical protein
MIDGDPEIRHAITHRAHPAVPPLLHLVAHLLDRPLVRIRIVAAKICQLVVVQVIVVVQLGM